MSVPRNVAEVIREHVTLEVEGIDRMYLNVYQPKLQSERGVASFFRHHRGQLFASSALMDPIAKNFIQEIEAYVHQHGLDLITFGKGQRKDDLAAEYRARFQGSEGILFVGKAQEKATVCRTEKRTNPQTGQKYPWFFEEVIRENLDLGRPDQVQFIFDRRVTKRTPGRFRTRVLTAGVIPSLHIDYKHSRIKQWHKEGRALRTETTINDTRDFGIGKRLHNLPALREVGFQANRRLLNVQTIGHDCAVGEDAFRQVNEPVVVAGQRASALRFADVAVQALFSALLVFRLLPRGFSNRDLRDHWAPLLGKSAQTMTQGQMSYHLRRLRLHGLIERLPKTHRYRVTDSGCRTALFCTRTYNRILRPGLAQVVPSEVETDTPLRRCFDRLDAAIEDFLEPQKVPA